jgi:predicted metal-dependent peptidase
MNIEEKIDFAKKLQNHHYFFRAFWDIGHPVFGEFDDLDTAAIFFDTEGESIQLKINTSFWNSLNDNSKLFLICHEMCHIVLQHGKRFRQYINTSDFQIVNYAADVVINEMLCKSFKFQRDELDDRLSKKGCWYDTVFPNQNFKRDESTEYYFNLLKQSSPPQDLQSFDVHIVHSEEIDKSIEDVLKDNDVFEAFKDDNIPNCNKEFVTKIEKDFGIGSQSGSMHDITYKKSKKKKWETVIKQWELKNKKDNIFSEERWERLNPRYSGIINEHIHLPTNNNILTEVNENDKISVFFFLDTSGSCISLAGRFFSAAHSLDPKKFDIRLFCFDTSVVETSLETKKIYGGGGTAFNIMENQIQSIIKKERKKYPKAVFVITDGYGTSITPEKPKNWYWFLTGNYRYYIPKESKVFLLSDFE